MTFASRSDHAALRRFAYSLSWAFPLVFGLFLPWLFAYPWQIWPLALSSLLLLLAWLKPGWLYYPYRAWMTLGLVLGWINSRIILTLLFYLLITPLGLVLRALGKLQYQRSPKAQHDSYWHTSQSSNKSQLEKPF
jgi:Saxitoxin biosynthesis operon protein SxtJ